jgi:hypothetical protein
MVIRERRLLLSISLVILLVGLACSFTGFSAMIQVPTGEDRVDPYGLRYYSIPPTGGVHSLELGGWIEHDTVVVEGDTPEEWLEEFLEWLEELPGDDLPVVLPFISTDGILFSSAEDSLGDLPGDGGYAELLELLLKYLDEMYGDVYGGTFTRVEFKVYNPRTAQVLEDFQGSLADFLELGELEKGDYNHPAGFKFHVQMDFPVGIECWYAKLVVWVGNRRAAHADMRIYAGGFYRFVDTYGMWY